MTTFVAVLAPPSSGRQERHFQSPGPNGDRTFHRKVDRMGFERHSPPM